MNLYFLHENSMCFFVVVVAVVFYLNFWNSGKLFLYLSDLYIHHMDSWMTLLFQNNLNIVLDRFVIENDDVMEP